MLRHTSSTRSRSRTNARSAVRRNRLVGTASGCSRHRQQLGREWVCVAEVRRSNRGEYLAGDGPHGDQREMPLMSGCSRWSRLA
jgi:hypothetical protein